MRFTWVAFISQYILRFEKLFQFFLKHIYLRMICRDMSSNSSFLNKKVNSFLFTNETLWWNDLFIHENSFNSINIVWLEWYKCLYINILNFHWKLWISLKLDDERSDQIPLSFNLIFHTLIFSLRWSILKIWRSYFNIFVLEFFDHFSTSHYLLSNTMESFFVIWLSNNLFTIILLNH